MHVPACGQPLIDYLYTFYHRASYRTLRIRQGKILHILRHKSSSTGIELIVKAMIIEFFDEARIRYR